MTRRLIAVVVAVFGALWLVPGVAHADPLDPVDSGCSKYGHVVRQQTYSYGLIRLMGTTGIPTSNFCYGMEWALVENSSPGMRFAVTNVGGMTQSFNVPADYNWGWTDTVSGPGVACVHDWNHCTGIG